MPNKNMIALGLMSGTSMDGIDISLLKSDGENINERGINSYYPYPESTKNLLHKIINCSSISLLEIKEIELEITKKHIEAVNNFLTKNKINPKNIDLVGFHGQTILHHPEQKITWQIGNAQMLASAININVVADFRTKDIIYGGNGAPLVPIYHLALFKKYTHPLLVLNIGGVSNITYIENTNPNNLIAADICFGNAPINDLMRTIGKDFDDNGNLASTGKINHQLATEFLSHNYFTQPFPKSLDRNQFKQGLEKLLSKLNLADSLATITFIIGQSVKISLDFLPKQPKEIIMCGGGRKNGQIIKEITQATGLKITDIDNLGIDGDFVEAEAFAFLAIRSANDLPISYPKTTGISPEKYEPQIFESLRPFSCGGVFYHA